MPYIVDRDGRVLGDSSLIIQHLAAMHGHTLDHRLSEAQRAIGHALRRMLEEHTYFAMVVLRWDNEDAWPHQVEGFAPLMPPGMKTLGVRLLRRSNLAKARAQGVGRHSHDEVLTLLDADLAAVEALLGSQPFLLGEAPTTVDATGYAFLAELLHVPWESRAKELMRQRAALVAYVERMKEHAWAGWTPER